MIKEAGKSLGLKVLDFESGELLAILNWPIINPDTGVIEAFWVKPVTVAMRNAVIQVADIVEFKKNLYIKSDKVIANPADVIRLDDILSSERPYLNAVVKNEAGHVFGRVVDFSYNTETYMLSQIMVEKTLLGIFHLSGRIFTWPQIIRVTEEGIIVDDSSDVKEGVVNDVIEPAAG